MQLTQLLSQRCVRLSSMAITFWRPAALMLAAVVVSCATLQSASADDGRGRLPDGRAFRKDASGNTMVDYIAELELEVDSLRRQVQGLESERDNNELRIASRSPEGCQAPLTEKNILQGSAQPAALNCPKCEQKVCPPVQKDCSAQVRTAEDTCSVSLEKVNQSYLARLKSSNIQVEQKEREIEKLLSSIEQQSGQIETLRVAAQKKTTCPELKQASCPQISCPQVKTATSPAVKPVACPELKPVICPPVQKDCSKEIATISEGFEKKGKEKLSQIADFQKQIADKDHAIELLLNQNEQLKIEKAKEAAAIRASFKPIPEQKEAPALPVKAERIKPKSTDPLDNARSLVFSELTAVTAALNERNTMYAQYKQRPTTVTFTPAAPTSDKGRSLSQLKESINQALTMRELSLVRREVTEIKTKIDFDRGMMKRLMTLKQ